MSVFIPAGTYTVKLPAGTPFSTSAAFTALFNEWVARPYPPAPLP